MSSLGKFHEEAETCPTCLWLSTHDAYEDKSLCGKEECPYCLQAHLDLSVDWLKSLRGSTSEFSAAISLYLSHHGFHNSSCVLKYARKYLAHLLRNGDCLSVYGRHGKNKLIMMYYQGKFYSSPFDTSYGRTFMDITAFGRSNYFSRVAPHCTSVWTGFFGYERRFRHADERLGYALWEVSKNFDASKASILGHKLPPELIGLIVAYLQDKWYVLCSLGEIIPESLNVYSYGYCGRSLNCGNLRLIEGMIPDKTKILYSSVLNTGS